MYDVVAYVQDNVIGQDFVYQFQIRYKKQIPAFLQNQNLTLLNMVQITEVKRSDAEEILQTISKAII